jgi:hypothetical protein
MRVQPIIDQLSDLGFVTLQGALEFAGLRNVPGRMPACFVVPQSDTAAANRYASGAIDQKVTETWAVVIILDSARRAGATKISEDLQDWRDRIFGKLVGWKHPDASDVATYAGGSLLSVDGTALVWSMSFRAPYHIRKV